MTIRDRFDAFAAQFRSSAPKETVEKPPLPPGAAPLLWCVLLTGVGIAALVGSTWMLLVFVAGSVGHVDWHSDYSATNDGPASFVWSVKASIHWLVGVGLFLFCAAIAMFNATWLEARRHIAPVVTRRMSTSIEPASCSASMMTRKISASRMLGSAHSLAWSESTILPSVSRRR